MIIYITTFWPGIEMKIIKKTVNLEGGLYCKMSLSEVRRVKASELLVKVSFSCLNLQQGEGPPTSWPSLLKYGTRKSQEMSTALNSIRTISAPFHWHQMKKIRVWVPSHRQYAELNSTLPWPAYLKFPLLANLSKEKLEELKIEHKVWNLLREKPPTWRFQK